MTPGKTIALIRPLQLGKKKELKNLFMKVKGETEEVGFKLNSQKTKIMASDSITSR